MTTKTPTVAIVWRDENYGAVRAVAAFRNYAGSFNWSARTQQRFRGCLQRAGFAFHDRRCSFIAETGSRDERRLALCTELAKAGFAIIRGDVRPEITTSTAEPSEAMAA